MHNKRTEAKNGCSKVLVIYYSHSGNTRKVAYEIHKTVGGDIVEIELTEPYPADYSTLVAQAKRELHTGSMPHLKTRVGDMSAYDKVFVGSPNWWQTISPPVISFLSQSELSNKTIIPFITHGGGGLGRSAEDIATLCPNAKVLKSIVVYGADVSAARKQYSTFNPE